MSGHLDVIGTATLAVVVLMVAAWLVSIARRDVSIVDVVWPLGLILVTGVSSMVGDGDRDRSILLVAMVTIWGLRLAGHLLRRNLAQGEDPRYTALRRMRGDNFAMTSLFTVFLYQGVLMLLVSLPVQLAMTPRTPDVGFLMLVGVVVWGVGFFFEVVGDAQLSRFRADPDNDGTVLDSGLWRYTRHPNYFGDCCVWWGIWIAAAETGDAAYAVGAPVLMTWLLLRVTGASLLERRMAKTRPAYAAYAERTSMFIPRPPRSAVREDTS